MHDATLTKILETASLLFQRQSEQLNQLLALAETAIRQGAAQQQNAADADDEQVLSVWAKYPQGTRLTKEQICDALGLNRDNGTMGKRLGRLKAAGKLGNDYPKVPGYFLTEDHCHDGRQA